MICTEGCNQVCSCGGGLYQGFTERAGQFNLNDIGRGENKVRANYAAG
jgi:hypothetical protein